jgi:hypothetical protein
MTTSSTLVLAANLSDSRLTGIARDLARDLTRAGIETRMLGRAARGSRGDAVTLGQLALDLVMSGAVAALIECLKAYIAREPTLMMHVKRQDGSEIEISAKNVDDPELKRALDAAFRPK